MTKGIESILIASSDPKALAKFYEEKVGFKKVEGIDAEIEKVKGNSVKVIQEKYHIEGYGYLATFEDLDGNHFQLAQVKG